LILVYVLFPYSYLLRLKTGQKDSRKTFKQKIERQFAAYI